MDMNPTRNLVPAPPPKILQPDREASFEDTPTPTQYFSGYEPANDEEYDSAEEDFSFAFFASGQSKSPDITADELFSHGQLLPLYPAFSKFKEDTSTTEDDVEVLETVSTSHPETMSDYCEWSPQSAPTSPCRKSRSTGSAKKWIFHDVLAGARSQSDGKEKFVFLEKAPTTQSQVKAKDKAPVDQAKPHRASPAKEEKIVKVEKRENGNGKKKEIDLATAYKSLYGMRKDKGKLKEGEKRRSFLPYFGFFGGGLNAFTKTSYPY